MSFSENASETWKGRKKLVCRPAFEKLERHRNAQVKWEGNEEMNVVACNMHAVNDDFVLLRSVDD
jgi:hypothetical protein